jgi:hypothetical protein
MATGNFSLAQETSRGVVFGSIIRAFLGDHDKSGHFPQREAW